MNFKTERDYQTRVIKDLKKNYAENSIGLWLYKIPDVNMQIKPFDIIGCSDGNSFAIELKICNLKKGLTYEQAYKMLRPNQVGALDAHSKAGGGSFVFVWNIAEEKEYRFEFKFLDGVSTSL